MSRSVLRMLVTSALIGLAAATARAADWKPLDPADLALKAPKVQPDAHAEAILWDVRVSDELDRAFEPTTIFESYIKIKIFTERGREDHATVDIPYISGIDIKDVAARTTKKDGTTIELKSSDVFRRTIVKAGDVQVKVVSFAVPGIEPGAIIEYRWREVHHESLANYLRLPYSRNIPVHATRYQLRPLSIPGLDLQMFVQGFNAAFQPPQQQKDGFMMIGLTDVPADRDEAYAIPPFERRPWMLVYYEPRGIPRNRDYWEQFSKEIFEDYDKRSKPSDEIKKAAVTAAPAGGADAQRIEALARAARARIKRVDVDSATAADRRAAKENKNAADAFKRGLGTADDLIVVFLALAKSAGFDARVAATPNRADIFHKSGNANAYFVRGRLVALRTAERWTFVDPSNEHSATGALRWYYELAESLISDPKTLTSVRTPLTPAAKSVKQRTGTFRLSEDGTLEGECRLEFTGHWAQTFREQDDQSTDADREKSVRDVLTKRLPGAEITDVRIENISDPDKPYVNAYKIKVPGYAQRTGTRVFLQPAFFEKGVDAVFASAARTSEVYFPYPWTEEDTVTIELPAGYVLEQPEAPADINAGAGIYSVTMSSADKWKHLTLKRTFAFGLKDQVLFPTTAYPAIKQFFDAVHASDAHTLILRPAAR